MDGSWIFGEETLSELGGDRPGALIFNVGVIIEGFLAMVFSCSLLEYMKGSLLGRIGAGLLLIASIFLIGVGVFPITTGDPHTFFSYAFFLTALIALIVLVLPVARRVPMGGGLSILTAGLVLVSIGFLVTSSIPMTEAVAVICLLIWSGSISLVIGMRGGVAHTRQHR